MPELTFGDKAQVIKNYMGHGYKKGETIVVLAVNKTETQETTYKVINEGGTTYHLIRKELSPIETCKCHCS